MNRVEKIAFDMIEKAMGQLCALPAHERHEVYANLERGKLFSAKLTDVFENDIRRLIRS